MLIGHRRDFSSRADILNVNTSSTYLIKPIILPLINNYGHDDDKDIHLGFNCSPFPLPRSLVSKNNDS